VHNAGPGVFDSAVSPHPLPAPRARQAGSPLPWGEGSRVRGKGANEYEGFPLSNSGLTDAPCPAFTHWKRRGTLNFIMRPNGRV